MRNWWVNQNQTYRQEIGGGYMWSPKVSKNGKLNPFYEFMREVAPGDLVFSFADTRIKAVGIATSPCYDCPKPPEFGPAGKVWGQSGWRVDVRLLELKNQIKPAQHMATIAMYLPEKYSPLQPSGAGLQSVYLMSAGAQDPPVAGAGVSHRRPTGGCFMSTRELRRIDPDTQESAAELTERHLRGGRAKLLCLI